MSNQLPLHPFSDVFPAATVEELQTIKASINLRGQIEPIVLLGGAILDGRNRYQVCRELKIPPQFRQYDPIKDGQDPLQWVIDKNLNRRHLTVGQRAALGASLTTLAKQMAAAKEPEKSAPTTPVGPPPDPAEETKPEPAPVPITQEQAAAALGVSAKSVGQASNLAKNDPERFEAVKSGKTSLHAATQASKAESETSDQTLLGKTTATIPNQYRSECADMLAATHGDKFSEAIRNDTILRDQQLREFMKLAVQDQKQIAAMVAKGWRVREAVKFAKGIFEKDDPIRDLLNLAIMRDGRAATTIDGHTILILSDAVLAETKGEFILPYVAATLLAQRKPETTAPPVENNLGKAMEKPRKWKPGDPAPASAKPSPKEGKSSDSEHSSPGSKDATPKGAEKKSSPDEVAPEKVRGLKPKKAPAKKK